MTNDEVLNRLRELSVMVEHIYQQIVPPYPGADSFGQSPEGCELTLRAGLVKRTNND